MASVALKTPTFTLPLPDRETIQARLTSSHHDAGTPLTDMDRRILELLLDTPLKKPNPCKEKFMLYQATLDLYTAALTGRIPAQFGVQMLQNHNKRKVYELLFNTLYHYGVLDEILIESGFFSRHFSLHGTGPLLYIMLFDYQDCGFSIPFHRPPEEIDRISDFIPKIAQALLKHKTKLNGTLARMRVRSSVPTISQLIRNDITRESCMMTSFSPCYARVNILKCSQDDVLKKLFNDGYKRVGYLSELHNHTKSFYIIEDDFLAFSADCRKLLDIEPLVLGGCLVLQDIMSYRFVKRIEDKIRECDGDIIVTESNSGYEIAHIATLLGFEGKVFVFDSFEDGSNLAKSRIAKLGLRNVIFTDTSFACITCDDDVLSELNMIICVPETAPCSKDNKVDIAMQEGDRLLPFLVKPAEEDGRISVTDVFELKSCFSTALALKRARYILYMSLSDCPTYNEKIVTKQVEEFNKIATDKKYLHYELVTTIPRSSMDYFTAIIEQEVRPEIAASMVIARAIANGLIDGEGISQNKLIKQEETKSKPKKSIKPFKVSLTTTISYQQKCVPKRERGPKAFTKPTFKF